MRISLLLLYLLVNILPFHEISSKSLYKYQLYIKIKYIIKIKYQKFLGMLIHPFWKNCLKHVH